MSSVIQGTKLTPVDEAVRVQQGGAVTVSRHTRAPVETMLSKEWVNTADSYDRGKGFGWRRLEKAEPEAAHELFFNRLARKPGSNLTPIKWNTTVTTEPVQAGELTLVAYNHENRLVASRGDKVVWTFLGSGRMGQPPLIIGHKALIACHDGYVYALKLADGSLAWRSMIAPQERRHVAYNQVESAWPCYGLVEVDGVVITIAGRVSTMDHGLFAAGLDPATGKQQWRIRLATDPKSFTADADEDEMAEFGHNWIREFQTLNMPPQLINGRIYVMGRLSVDPKNPRDTLR